MAATSDPSGAPATPGPFGRTDDELAKLPMPYAPGLFRGKVAVVSGGGSGIGRATAHWLARLGADVVICSRKPEKLEPAAESLRRYGGKVVAKTLSIRDPEAVNRFFEEVWSELGRVDLLVNNAGGQFAQPAIDFAPKGWNAVIDTNLNGTWYMMQAAARKWRDAGTPGCIVNIIANIWRGLPGIAHACAARAGVAYLSKTVAIEWAPLHIRINCIAPGIVATEGMNVYSPEAVQDYPNTNLVRRFARVEEIASAICFLGSELSGFMTGEVLCIDGGNQLWGDQWTIPKPDFFRV
jgi:citronellol/citronellal dehydrogenase